MGEHPMTAAQVADALGIRPATVYAYVSRGVLRRTTTVSEDGRRISLFDRDEVLALAAARARPRAGVLATLIESDVTELDPRGRLLFRGRDVADLARLSFEEAACLLWADDGAAAWLPVDPSWAAAVEHGVPPSVTCPQDRILLAVTLAATADECRGDIGRTHVLRVAAGAIQLATRSLGGPPDTAIAPALWQGLTGCTANDDERAAIEAAMIVMLDHELAASTMAARVAASTQADPWMSLLAGLASLRGPLHGGASGLATAVLRHWLTHHTVVEPPLGGFGHKVYEGMDPRAEIILDRVAVLDPDLMLEIDALIVAVAREYSVMPNADLGLAALAVAADLPDGAAESLFMIARMAGFAAHVLEEYPHGLRYRLRAVSSG